MTSPMTTLMTTPVQTPEQTLNRKTSRRLFSTLLLASLTWLAATPAMAMTTLKGDIQFSDDEIAHHLRSLPTIIQTTTDSMKEITHEHFATYNECGVGLLYGFHSAYAGMTGAQRQSYIATHAKCSRPPRLSEITETSCEMFTTRHLEKGFAAAGDQAIYDRINGFYNANQRTGIALAYALKKLGWKSVYWNTDVNAQHPSPLNRHTMGATPTDHTYSYQTALRAGTYYDVPVDNFLINFSPEPGSRTAQDLTAFNAFKRVPYFIGIAHGGFHVFPGYYGTVNESHSPYQPASVDNIQVGDFGPPNQSPKGLNVTDGKGKKLGNYFSGVIVMPPGNWMWF